jgi:thiol-disulfide isomerase/thioredoxin
MTQRLWEVVFVVCLLGGCGGTIGTKTEAIEVGWLHRSILDKPELHQFKARYDTVALEEDLVGLICSVNSGVDFLVFFGTWCGDSRRELPHFLRIADQCGIESSRIRLYGLDRSKKSNDGLSDQYRIEKVPTFIFLKDGGEVGRITETPNTTLEADMLSILAAAQK